VTIWDLLLITSVICSAIWTICAWCYFFSSMFARGTHARAIWSRPLTELRFILREATAVYIVTNWIWQAHDGSLDGWDFLGYGCYIFTTWIIWNNTDDDDRWAKRFRKLATFLTPKPHPETA